MLCSNRKKTPLESKGEQAIDRADGTQAPPRFLSTTFRSRASCEAPAKYHPSPNDPTDPISRKDRPDRRFAMWAAKGGNGRDNDENVRRPRFEGSFCPL